MKDTETELVVCVGLYQRNGKGSWVAPVRAEAKANVFPGFASKIVTCLRGMGLLGADLVLVLKTEICLWIWVLQSGKGAEIKIAKQISCFLQCQCSPRARVYIEIHL